MGRYVNENQQRISKNVVFWQWYRHSADTSRVLWCGMIANFTIQLMHTLCSFWFINS